MEELLANVRSLVAALEQSKDGANTYTETAQSLFSVLSACVDVLNSVNEQVLEFLRTGGWLHTMEKVLQCKNLQLYSGLRQTVVRFYVAAFDTGEIMHLLNCIRSLQALLVSKNINTSQRTCVVQVLGRLFELYGSRMTSTVSDIVPVLLRISKALDPRLRTEAATSIMYAVAGVELGLGNLHPDILKGATRLSSDRSPEVRVRAAKVLALIAARSNNFSSVSMESLVVVVCKGIEDEVPGVQRAYGEALAYIYDVSIEAQKKEDELKQVRSARDQEKDLNPTPQPSGMDKAVAKLRDLGAEMRPSSRRIVTLVENTPRSITRFLVQRLSKCPTQHQPGWAMALLALLRTRVSSLTTDELEEVLMELLEPLRVQTPNANPNTDTLLRARLAYALRAGLCWGASEQQQLHIANNILTFLKDPSRGEHEIQMLLSELGHLCATLADATVAVAEEIRKSVTPLLRHSSYFVRADAATTLLSLARVNTRMAVDILQEARTSLSTQAQALMAFASDNNNMTTEPANKKQRDAERLQRMFHFHGCGMLISFMLQNMEEFFDELPEDVIAGCVDMGFYLVQRFLLAKYEDSKAVVCTLARTGWNILSSFISAGYAHVKPILPKLMSTWTENIFTICAGAVPGYELAQELVCLDSALTSVEALLRFCPTALYQHPEALRVSCELLEASSLVIKERFQPKLLNTLRFRVLKGTLMNAFAWLPCGSFPSTCPSMFVDALRMLCDTTSAGVESAALNLLVRKEDGILDVDGELRPPGTAAEDGTDTYDNEMVHLESFAQALHKKENEAAVFLTHYNRKFDRFLSVEDSSPLHGNEWRQPLPLSHSVDIRILDAAISLLAATFGQQSNDIQLKAVKAIDSLVPSAVKRMSTISISMLSTDEEKRKRDRKNLSAAKNATAALLAIAQSLPGHAGDDLSQDMPWVGEACSLLLSLLASHDSSTRRGACEAIALLAKKMGPSLQTTMMNALKETLHQYKDRKLEPGHVANTCAGALFAVACIWRECGGRGEISKREVVPILMEWLRNLDTPLYVRTWALHSAATMVGHMDVGQDVAGVSETLSTLRVLVSLLELHLCVEGAIAPEASTAITSLPPPPSWEEEAFMCACVRVVNTVVPVIMDIEPDSSLVKRVVRVWEIVRICSSHTVVVQECMNTVELISYFSHTSLRLLDVADLIHGVLSRPVHHGISTLKAAVSALRNLSKRALAQVCELQLDVSLIQALETCVRTLHCSVGCMWKGFVMVRVGCDRAQASEGMESVVMNAASCLEAMVKIDVDAAADERAVRWALFLRAVALGTSAWKAVMEGSDNTGGDRDNRDDEDPSTAGESKLQVDDKSTPDLSVRASCNVDREQAAQRAASVGMIMHSKVRCIVTECATLAIGSLCTVAHSCLPIARQKMDEAIRLQVYEIPPTEGASISTPRTLTLGSGTPYPSYACFFVNELISYACVCVSASVDDTPLTSLQKSGVVLLHSLLTLFLHTQEGDASSPTRGSSPSRTSSNAQHASTERILQQLTSQMVSAVRGVLGPTTPPELLWLAGCVCIDLMCSGLVTDAVVVKRLVKQLLPPAADFGTEPEDGRKRVYTPVQDSKRSKSLNLRTHIVRTALLARLHVLAHDTNADMHTHTFPIFGGTPELSQILRGFVESSKAGQTYLQWRGIVCDGVRIRLDDPGWPRSHGLAGYQYGGVTYEPGMDITQEAPMYRSSVSWCIAALCIPGKADSAPQLSDIQFLFAVSHLLIKTHDVSFADARQPFRGGADDTHFTSHKRFVPQEGIYPDILFALYALKCLATSQIQNTEKQERGGLRETNGESPEHSQSSVASPLALEVDDDSVARSFTASPDAPYTNAPVSIDDWLAVLSDVTRLLKYYVTDSAKTHMHTSVHAGKCIHTHTHTLLAQLAVGIADAVLSMDTEVTEKAPQKVLELVMTCLCLEYPRMSEALKESMACVFGVQTEAQREEDFDDEVVSPAAESVLRASGHERRLLAYLTTLKHASAHPASTPAFKTLCGSVSLSVVRRSEDFGDEWLHQIVEAISAVLLCMSDSSPQQTQDLVMSELIDASRSKSDDPLRRLQAILTIWQTLALNSNLPVAVPQFEALLLTNTNPNVKTLLHTYIRITIQTLISQPQTHAHIHTLAHTVIPPLLVHIHTHTQMNDDDIAAISATSEALKTVLLVFNTLAPDTHTHMIYISTLLHAVSPLLCPPRGLIGRACASGLTHLARISADSFRSAVMGLSSSERDNLQASMKEVLSQSQGPSAGISSSNPNPNPSKLAPPRLDASKFRK